MKFRWFRAGLALRRIIPVTLIVLGLCRLALMAAGSPAQTVIKRTDVPFTVCKQSATWTLPTPEQQARIWNDPRYAGHDLKNSHEWTHDFQLVPPDSASIQGEVQDETGLWIEGVWDRKCDNEEYKHDDQWIMAWILLHRVQSITAADGVYTIRVAPTAKGFQSIIFKRLSPNMSVRFIDPQGKVLDEVKP